MGRSLEIENALVWAMRDSHILSQWYRRYIFEVCGNKMVVQSTSVYNMDEGKTEFQYSPVGSEGKY